MRSATSWLLAAAACIPLASHAAANDLVISGVVDGPLTGGTPKAIELYVLADIPDLSQYGVGSANNGTGTDGEEFTFPPVAATAGQFIYVASEAIEFENFFGFAPDYVNGAANINGDDAIELFFMGGVIDVFGDINTDGTGQPWEYLDGWAYRNAQTGPDGSTFVIENWTFSGPNALDGETSNSTAATPFPIGTYFFGDDCDNNGLSDADEIANNASLDCNNDGILDVCQLTPDSDCDDNMILDECEIADDPSIDCNTDGILDICQLAGNDCNENGVLDSCDIANMTSTDDNMDGFPDECQVSGVVINEILADPEKLVGDTNGDGIISFTDDEFVEIYNNTGGDLDLSGWMLSDSSAVRHIFPAGTVIADQCTIVVFGGGCLGDANFNNITAQAASEGGLFLDNDEDTVMLIDTTGIPATIVSYSEIAALNSSITRVPEITGEFDVHFFAWGTRFSPGTQGDGSAFLGCPDDPPLADADGDGVSDDVDNCELPNPCQEDCNGNNVGDVCDIENGFADCNNNGLLDICEEFDDCNGNFIPDECDIAAGEPDCNGNGIPDICEVFLPGVDCNGNLVPDICDIAADPDLDMNGNLLIDSCEVEPPAGVTINEVRIDQPGSGDEDEYVEISGPAGASLDGIRYLVIGDGPGGSGSIEVNLDLSGLTIPADGLLVIAEDTFSLTARRGGVVDFTAVLDFENSDNVTHLLAANVNGGLGIDTDIDADDDGVIDPGTWWTHVLDAVGLKEDDAGDLLYAEALGGSNVGPDGFFVPAHAYRCVPEGTWTIGTFDPFSIDPPSADTPGADNPACDVDCPGDSNGDLTVDLDDLLEVIGNWGGVGPAGDVTGDGAVNLDDLLEVIGNWGSSCG